MAPEIFARQRFDGVAADIYSCGVILFILLTGTPPYNTPDPSDARFRYIYGGKLRALLQRWGFIGRIDEGAIQLLQMLLSPPDRRPTIRQILMHAWLQRS